MKVVTTVLAVLTRRGLGWLGIGADVVSDNDIAEFVGWSLFVGNEIYQALRAHEAGVVPGGVGDKILVQIGKLLK